MSDLEVIDEILERNPRTAEAGRSIHDFGINHDDALECHCFPIVASEVRIVNPLPFLSS